MSRFPSCRQPGWYSVPWPESGKPSQASPAPTAPLLQPRLDGYCNLEHDRYLDQRWVGSLPLPSAHRMLWGTANPGQDSCFHAPPQDAIGCLPTLTLLTSISRFRMGREQQQSLGGRAERGASGRRCIGDGRADSGELILRGGDCTLAKPPLLYVCSTSHQTSLTEHKFKEQSQHIKPQAQPSIWYPWGCLQAKHSLP